MKVRSFFNMGHLIEFQETKLAKFLNATSISRSIKILTKDVPYPKFFSMHIPVLEGFSKNSICLDMESSSSFECSLLFHSHSTKLDSKTKMQALTCKHICAVCRVSEGHQLNGPKHNEALNKNRTSHPSKSFQAFELIVSAESIYMTAMQIKILSPNWVVR